MEITGRVTADAQVRSLSEGKQVVNFSVAVNDSYKAKNGERVTQTDFFDCSYWIGTGIAQYLTKGTVVELSGRVSARAWVDAQGQAKAGLNFHTSKITLHGGGQPASGGAAKGQQAKAEQMEATGTVVQGDREKDDLPF
jgi:single-strand DNA-binding protein